MATTETIAAFPLLGTVETGSSFPWLNAAGDGNYRSGKDALADFLEVGTLLAAKQGLDATLSALSGVTTASYGMSLLGQADATTARTTLGIPTLLAAKQDSNTSLDAIAGMTPSAYGLSLLDDADAGTARTTLGLGSLSLLSSLETGALTHAPTNYTPSAATMAGHLGGIDTALSGGGGAFAADANTLITASTAIVLGQATGDETALTLNYTTNKAAGNDTGLLINQIDTLSNGTSKLLDLQVGGASKFSVANNGHVVAKSANFGDVFAPGFLGTQANIFSGGTLGWTDAGTANTSSELKLGRDANNILGQRNGVNAQTFNIYNTADTSLTNYERAHIGWDTNTFVISTEAAGTGTLRGLSLGATGNSVSLYGVTPVAQAAHIADATDATDVITRVNAILVALENLGVTAAA